MNTYAPRDSEVW